MIFGQVLVGETLEKSKFRLPRFQGQKFWLAPRSSIYSVASIDIIIMTDTSNRSVQTADSRTCHCKHPAHSCVVGCKERGGGLAAVTALTALGMKIICLFMRQWSLHMFAAVTLHEGAGFKDAITTIKIVQPHPQFLRFPDLVSALLKHVISVPQVPEFNFSVTLLELGQEIKLHKSSQT